MSRPRSTQADVLIGRAIERVRRDRRLSQHALAKAIGVSFQQIQKYENGQNRVACARLIDIATALDAAPSDFFPAPVARQDERSAA